MGDPEKQKPGASWDPMQEEGEPSGGGVSLGQVALVAEASSREAEVSSLRKAGSGGSSLDVT